LEKQTFLRIFLTWVAIFAIFLAVYSSIDFINDLNSNIPQWIKAIGLVAAIFTIIVALFACLAALSTYFPHLFTRNKKKNDNE
jgi:hypothetical protein